MVTCQLRNIRINTLGPQPDLFVNLHNAYLCTLIDALVSRPTNTFYRSTKILRRHGNLQYHKKFNG